MLCNSEIMILVFLLFLGKSRIDELLPRPAVPGTQIVMPHSTRIALSSRCHCRLEQASNVNPDFSGEVGVNNIKRCARLFNPHSWLCKTRHRFTTAANFGRRREGQNCLSWQWFQPANALNHLLSSNAPKQKVQRCLVFLVTSFLRVSPLELLISSQMCSKFRISTGGAGEAVWIPFPR